MYSSVVSKAIDIHLEITPSVFPWICSTSPTTTKKNLHFKALESNNTSKHFLKDAGYEKWRSVYRSMHELVVEMHQSYLHIGRKRESFPNSEKSDIFVM